MEEKDELHLQAPPLNVSKVNQRSPQGLIAFLWETIGCTADGNTQYSADSLRRLMSGQSRPVNG
jgi:hypothetical protein